MGRDTKDDAENASLKKTDRTSELQPSQNDSEEYVRDARAKMKTSEMQFSMSDGQSGSKFGIDGLDSTETGAAKKLPREETKEDFIDPESMVKKIEEGGTLTESEKAIGRAIGALGNVGAKAVKAELGKVTAQGAKEYLLENWDNLSGEDGEIDLEELENAIGGAGKTAEDRAKLVWAAVNFDKIRDLQGAGAYSFGLIATDMSKDDVKAIKE